MYAYLMRRCLICTCEHQKACVFCAAGRADEGLLSAERFRIFRAEKSYGVSVGRWYFELEVVTAGEMRVGWARPGCLPDQELGSDEQAFVFDGFKVKPQNKPHYIQRLVA